MAILFQIQDLRRAVPEQYCSAAMRLLLVILALALIGCEAIQQATRTTLSPEDRNEAVIRARNLACDSGLLSDVEKSAVMTTDPKIGYYNMGGGFAQYGISWSLPDGSAIEVYGEGNLPDLQGAKVVRKPNKRAGVDAGFGPLLAYGSALSGTTQNRG